MADQDQYCGQSSVVDRKIVSASGRTISTHAIATNIARYSGFPSETSDASGFTKEGHRGKEKVNHEKVNLGSSIDMTTSGVPAKKVRVR